MAQISETYDSGEQAWLAPLQAPAANPRITSFAKGRVDMVSLE